MLKRLYELFFKKQWYDVWFKNDTDEGWGKGSTQIIEVAKKRGIRTGDFQAQGNRFIGVCCQEDEVQELMKVLGEADYCYSKSNSMNASLFRKNLEY